MDPKKATFDPFGELLAEVREMKKQMETLIRDQKYLMLWAEWRLLITWLECEIIREQPASVLFGFAGK